MSEPQIELREAQPYLGIRERLTAGVPEFADRVFPELFGWLGQNGVQPAGPPFIRYVELDPTASPWSWRWACRSRTAPARDARVRADALPAGRWLTYLHVGPYRSETATDLADAREELMGWAEPGASSPTPPRSSTSGSAPWRSPTSRSGRPSSPTCWLAVERRLALPDPVRLGVRLPQRVASHWRAVVGSLEAGETTSRARRVRQRAYGRCQAATITRAFGLAVR